MEKISEHIANEFESMLHVLQAFVTESNFKQIETIGIDLAHCFKLGNKVMICGNGGSMCDAIHFAEELTGRFRKDRPPLPAIAFADSGHISCVANDYGYSKIFARACQAYGKPNDVLILLSTSGNSPNILEAAKVANEMNICTVALTGKDGGSLKALCKHCICVPYAGSADRVQEIHIKILHTLIHIIELQLFPSHV